MSGLECSEVMLSDMCIDNEKGRTDSEFFQKRYVEAYNKIKSMKHSTIGEELETLTDFHANGSYESIAEVFELLDTPDYAYMVRTVDLERKNYTNDVKYISERAYNFFAKSKLYGGEVIINKIGNPGRTFLMPHLNRPVSLGMNLFMLKMKTNGAIDNILLYLFLNTNIGKMLIERKINGTVPLSIDKEAVKSIYIPCFSSGFREAVRHIIEESEEDFNRAKTEYTTAQQILQSAIHFETSSLSHENVTVKSFSEAFSTGRLDAEYFMPKYDDLFALLHELPTKTLGEIVSITKSIEPGSEYYRNEGIPFIRVSDISAMGITEPAVKIPRDTVPDIERLYPKKDTILLSKDGSVGIAYKIEDDTEAVTSGALLHLRVNDSEVLPDYLTLVLNSDIVRLQAERDTNGAVIQHWRPEEISRVVIPVADRETQNTIAGHVRESFSLRRKSERLINIAVKSVELAIESNEESAMNFITKETGTK